MYERSAIVLERYFENLFGYRREGNIRDNFNNYCDLVEKLEKYQINYEKELAASEEYEESLKKIRLIQASQKRLYEKSVKLEYNRNLLFSNIEAKVSDTQKCIEKIEADVEKNNIAMKEAKENLLVALNVYNEKRFELSKCKRYKKMAENAYNDSYENALTNYEAIPQDVLETAKKFENFDDAEDIMIELENNGKNEKIPFNEEVIRDATIYGIEIAKKEVAGYLVIVDKMTKILSDIEEGATKIELHKKYARNEKAKMDFIYAVKEYMTQFLDYERMTVIHGRKSHNRLMSEACENFEADTIQINNLFELLVKEITNKATKKSYKDLYNKNYLMDIQEKDEKFKREKNRVNLNTATLINTNYWRIDGIKEIFTIFYKTVSEVLGRNIDEFDVLNTDEDNQEPVIFEEELTEKAKAKSKAKEETKIEEKIKKEEKKEEKEEEKEEEVEKIPFEIEEITPSKETNKASKTDKVKKIKKKIPVIIEEPIEETDEDEANLYIDVENKVDENLEDEDDIVFADSQEELKENDEEENVDEETNEDFSEVEVDEDFDEEDEADEDFDEVEDEDDEDFDEEDEADEDFDEEDEADEDFDEEDEADEDFDEEDEADEDFDEEDEDDEDYNTADDVINSAIQSFQNDFDFFGDKYQEDDFLDDIKSTKKSKKIEKAKKEVEDDLYDIDDEEETLFENIAPIKRQRKGKDEHKIEEVEIEEDIPKTILKKVKKINKSKRNTTESDIW